MKSLKKFLKRIAIGIVGVAVIAGIVKGSYLIKNAKADSYVASATATSTPTRMEEAKQALDDMTEEQKNNPSFISETQRELNLFNQERDIDARLNALTVYKVEIQAEEYDLNNKLKNIKAQMTSMATTTL